MVTENGYEYFIGVLFRLSERTKHCPRHTNIYRLYKSIRHLNELYYIIVAAKSRLITKEAINIFNGTSRHTAITVSEFETFGRF